jgi:hypothetical protein
MPSNTLNVCNIDKSGTARGLEFVSLASIFPDEFELLDELPLQVCQDGGWPNGMLSEARCFRLRVRAETPPDKNYVEVDMLCGVGPGYPLSGSSVLVYVERISGLSDSLVQMLTKELRELASRLEGREMMYDLFQHAQDFLRSHNIDPKKSFYDQMIEQEKLQSESRKQEANAVHLASQQEAIQLKKEKKLQIQTQAREEGKRRKQLFRNAKPGAASNTTRDLWGSDSDPSSEGESTSHNDEVSSGHTAPGWATAAKGIQHSVKSSQPRQPADKASQPPAFAATQAGFPHAGEPKPEPVGRWTEGEGLHTSAWSTGRIAWKKFGSMKATGEGEVTMVPDILGIGRFGVVYMAMVESNETGSGPRPGSVIAIKEIALEEDSAFKRDQVAKAMAEIECQRSLTHENIVQVRPHDSAFEAAAPLTANINGRSHQTGKRPGL